MTSTDMFLMAEDAYYNAKSRGDTLQAIRWAIVLDTITEMGF